jgi:hypothetical protein
METLRSAMVRPAAAPMPSIRRRTMSSGSSAIEQDAPGLGHGEATQAGRAGGDGDLEEGLPAFWLAAGEADGFPQRGDQRALTQGAPGEVMGGFDRELLIALAQLRRPWSWRPAIR